MSVDAGITTATIPTPPIDVSSLVGAINDLQRRVNDIENTRVSPSNNGGTSTSPPTAGSVTDSSIASPGLDATLSIKAHSITSAQITQGGLNLVGGLTVANGLISSNLFQANQGSQFSYAQGTYVDPDVGVGRDAKFGAGGIAVLGGVKTDTLTVTATSTYGSTATFSGQATFNSNVAFNNTIAWGGRYVTSAAIALDAVTGAASAGIGNIAGATIDTYNLKDASVTAPKLSVGAITTTNVQTGTLGDTRFSLFRTLTTNTTDTSGRPVGGFTLSNTATRVTDGVAWDGVAAGVLSASSPANAGVFLNGPLYGAVTNDLGLAPGSYRAVFWTKVSSAASANVCVGFSAHCATAGVIQNDDTITQVAPTQLTSAATTQYVGWPIAFTVLTDTKGTAGLELRARYYSAASTDVFISHVTVEPYNAPVTNTNTGVFTPNAVMRSAQIADLNVKNLTTGVFYADLTQAGTFRTGPTTGPRVEFTSGGITGYTAAGTGSTSFTLTNTGQLTVTGTINAQGGTFSGNIQANSMMITGGTFSAANIVGSTIAVGSGNAIFKSDSQGIYLGNATFTSAPFSVDMFGNLIASNIKLLPVSLQEASILPNSKFQDIDGQTGLPSRWTDHYETTGTAPNAVSETTNPISGSKSLSISIPANSSDGDSVASDGIPVVPGEKYYLSVDFEAIGQANSSNIYVRVFFADATQPSNFTRANIGGGTPSLLNSRILNLNGTIYNANPPTGTGTGYCDILANFTVPTVGTTYRATGVVTVPPTAQWMRVVLYHWQRAASPAPSGTQKVTFDDVKVQQTMYNMQLDAGIINAATINGGSINGVSITGTTITGGTIQTNTSGQRISLDSTMATNKIFFYSGISGETPGSLMSNYDTYNRPNVVLSAGYVSPGSSSAYISLVGQVASGGADEVDVVGQQVIIQGNGLGATDSISLVANGSGGGLYGIWRVNEQLSILAGTSLIADSGSTVTFNNTPSFGNVNLSGTISGGTFAGSVSTSSPIYANGGLSVGTGQPATRDGYNILSSSDGAKRMQFGSVTVTWTSTANASASASFTLSGFSSAPSIWAPETIASNNTACTVQVVSSTSSAVALRAARMDGQNCGQSTQANIFFVAYGS